MRRVMQKSGLIALFFLLWLSEAVAAIEVTYRAAESRLDRRNDYTVAVLRLALEKTRQEYGDFVMHPAPSMNTTRARQEIQKGHYPNFIVKFSYDPALEQLGLRRGRFEPDLDITSYRVCFTAQPRLATLAQVQTLTLLRHFSHGQGNGWQDVGILRDNGFEVTEIGQYESLFKMVASGRFDLFCRGVNEAWSEWMAHAQVKQLALEPTILLYYPLPRFFYVNPRDAQLLERVDLGLQRAFDDGSLIRLWWQYYGPELQSAGLASRHLFYLENPAIWSLGHSPRIVYDPMQGHFHRQQPTTGADSLQQVLRPAR